MDRRSRLALLALLLVLPFLGATSFTIAQNGTPSSPRPVADLQFAQLKPDAAIAVELEPGAALDADGVWVLHRQSSAVVHIDRKTNAVRKPVAIGRSLCASLLVAFDSVWAASCEAGTVSRVEPKTGNVTASAPLPIAPASFSLGSAGASVWAITDARGVVSRIDPATNSPVAEAYVAGKPAGLTASDDTIWVTSQDGNLLTRIDANTNVIMETVKVGPRPGRVAVGEGAVWTLNRGDGSVSRVDVKTNKVVTTIAVSASIADGDLAVGEGAVWISAVGVPLTRIDPRSNRVSQRFVGTGGGAVTVGHGSVWVAAGPKLTWRLDPKLVAGMRP